MTRLIVHEQTTQTQLRWATHHWHSPNDSKQVLHPSSIVSHGSTTNAMLPGVDEDHVSLALRRDSRQVNQCGAAGCNETSDRHNMGA